MGLINSAMNLVSGGMSGASLDSGNASIDALMGALPPDLQSLIPTLQQQVVAGKITPEQAQTYLQQQSAMKGIKIPQQLLDAQNSTLSHLQSIANNGGKDAIDTAKLNQIQATMGEQERGQRQADQQDFAQRGMGGSGLQLASQMIGQQGAATRAAASGDQVASDAQQRALQALVQSGQLAGQMNDQTYNQQSQQAQAQDAINRFNTGMQSTTNQFNVANSNQAQAANLQNAQNVANNNTAITNQQRMMPMQVAQQGYTNQLDQSKALAGAYQNQAKLQADQAKNNTTAVGNTMDWLGKNSGAISSGISAIGSWFSDENLKKDIHELTSEDVDNIFSDLTGKKYQYKNGDGKQHYGVMAQEIEKHVPDAVVNTTQGKLVVDNDNMKSMMLAALANVHNRVKDLEGKK